MLMKAFLSLFALALVAPALAHDDHQHPNATDHHDGAHAWHKSLAGKPMKPHFKHHGNLTHIHNGTHWDRPGNGLPHHNGTHWVHKDHKRDVIYTIGTTDTGDSHWHVALWNDLDCRGPAAASYEDYIFMSSHCIKNPKKWKSFALKGNIKNCATFWYWDSDCSDPAEFSSVMGDVWCWNGPGAPGQQQVGSFRITCDGSNGGD